MQQFRIFSITLFVVAISGILFSAYADAAPRKSVSARLVETKKKGTTVIGNGKVRDVDVTLSYVATIFVSDGIADITPTVCSRGYSVSASNPVVDVVRAFGQFKIELDVIKGTVTASCEVFNVDPTKQYTVTISVAILGGAPLVVGEARAKFV